MLKELRRKQSIRRVAYSYPSLLLLSVLAFFLAKGAFGLVIIERESAGRVKELESDSTLLIDRERELKAEIARLKTPEGVVEEIKNKFSVTREGEYVAIIVDERNKAASAEVVKGPWFEEFWKGLKNLWTREP